MMRRLLLTLLLAGPTALAQEPKPPALTESEKKLEEQARTLGNQALQEHRAGRYADAVLKFQEALEIRRKVYDPARFPDGHPSLASDLYLVGFTLQGMGKVEQALPYHQQSLAMKRKLYPISKHPDGHPDLARSLNMLGFAFREAGQTEPALFHLQQGLEMRRNLYPTSKYPDGHADITESLNGIGRTLLARGRLEEAAAYFEQGLAMDRKLHPATKEAAGHPDLAESLTTLGQVLQAMGQLEKALPLFQESLAMYRLLYPVSTFPDGHPQLATGLTFMGIALQGMGQSERAVGYFEQSLDMKRKLFPTAKYPNGHPDLAGNINNLGTVLQALQQPEKARGHFKQSLAMYRLLYPSTKYVNGHTAIAATLNNLGHVSRALGDTDMALSYYEQSLDMRRKLYPSARFPAGHSDIALSLHNLGVTRAALGQQVLARAHFEQSLGMYRALYPVKDYPEGHPSLITGLRSLGSVLLAMGRAEEAMTYLKPALEMQQGLLEREMVTASESAALDLIAQLRGRTVHLYYSAAVRMPATATESYRAAWDTKGTLQRLLTRRRLTAQLQRNAVPFVREQLERSSRVQRELGRLLISPSKDRAGRDQRLRELSDEREILERALAKQVPGLERDLDLARLTPDDLLAALPATSVAIDFIQFRDREGGQVTGERYLAFVLAKGRPIQRIELGDAATIDRAIHEWRSAIESRQASPMAEKLRVIIWSKLVPHIPKGTTTLFVSPDGDLARLPWAALPIDEHRVLLEDYAVAAVPHARFLLEQLKFPPKVQGPEMTLLLGDVAYHSTTWKNLPGTKLETKALAALGHGDREMASQDDATVDRIARSLPKARYVHFATHGFFDAESLTAEKKQEAEVLKNRRTGDQSRRIVAKNPLAFVGLVLSHGEILSGLSLVDLPLEQLRLATLSACETGLGESTGGEGMQGLQRAFHIAGCPNVVASLWNVNDAATAALMAKFYHELWVNKKAPLAALREAQLFIYHHPESIPNLSGERGAPKQKEALAAVPAKPQAARADTKLWAAFVLSGVGK